MSNVVELRPRVLTLQNVEDCAGHVRRSLIAIETAQDGLRAALATGVPEALSKGSPMDLGPWMEAAIRYLAEIEILQGGVLERVDQTKRKLAAAARCER